MTETGVTVGSKVQALGNARVLLGRGQFELAIEQAREIISGDPDCADAHSMLGMALRKTGHVAEAQDAEQRAVELSSFDHDIFQATTAIAEHSLEAAEKILRPYLKEHPESAAAYRLLGEVAFRTGHADAAEACARKSLEIAPDYERGKALLESIRVFRTSDGDAQGTMPTGEAQYAEALELYEKVVGRFPDAADNWVSYGHMFRTVGAQEKAVAAYRRAIELRPDFGAAWWALADLKTRPLSEADIGQLEQLLAGGVPDEADRISLHFALGRALEHAARFEPAFEHYACGNSLKAGSSTHDRAAVTRFVDRSIDLFGADFFEQREGAGFDAADPIFILGMPRAGSTLIEQILSSHRDIEGTMELSDMPGIARWLGGGRNAGFEDSPYLDKLSSLGAAELGRLGQGYLWGTKLRRQTGKPYFTDKMPNNWLYVGMIATILPKAKIIDARRHPLACGMSLFRQNFAKGQEFSYDLTDIGSFYADYVRMMRHFDRVLPGRIIRVIHEELVSDPEAQIRRLLDALELPFDERCLRFHENKRAVRTASSEQVRRPINREGVDQWRHFEPWLGPLKEALGPIADEYPRVPDKI